MSRSFTLILQAVDFDNSTLPVYLHDPNATLNTSGSETIRWRPKDTKNQQDDDDKRTEMQHPGVCPRRETTPRNMHRLSKTLPTPMPQMGRRAARPQCGALPVHHLYGGHSNTTVLPRTHLHRCPSCRRCNASTSSSPPYQLPPSPTTHQQPYHNPYITVTIPQLKDAAAKWFQIHGEYITTWEEFQKRLTSHFARPTILAALHAEFYGREQQQTEMVETFLRHKVRLSQRLTPASPLDNLIPLLIELVHPGLRPFLRAPPPQDLEELITRNIDVERDLAKSCSTTSATSRPAETPSTSSELLPPRFHFCPECHFHRDCPILGHRRQDEEKRETTGRRKNQPHLWPRDPRATTNDLQRQSSDRQDPTMGPLRDLPGNAPCPTRHRSYLQLHSSKTPPLPQAPDPDPLL
ncbi:unnamed protein product [Timema podura]|uniref:Retrotransposon gag domain-containing protein n=1 Tax=Timema podura TaxID=61482 RepID=A0ABN7NS98_TIMPD|nr:unnamed protein product [Timema podura]